MKLVTQLSLAFSTLTFLVGSIMAQLSYDSPGQVLTQTFDDGLPSGAVTLDWTNNVSIPGWYIWQTGGGGTATNPDVEGVPAQYRRTDGISAGIRFYQWRAGPSAADGAFGSHASDASGDLIRAVRITNNSGTVLKSFSLGYTGEQWRTANTGGEHTITVGFLVGTPSGSPPDLATGNWSNVPALTFTSPVPGDGTGISANINGSAPENQTIVGPVTINATWNPGTDLWIRFYDDNSPGVDHGLAIDDVVLTASEDGDPSGLVLWQWCGSVTGTTARVVGKVTAGAEAVLEVTPEGGNTARYPSTERTASTGGGDLLSFPVTGLTPNVTYSYRIRSGNNVGETGTFRTFPVGPASFDFLFASCHNTGSTSQVFTTMASHNALFFYHMGDMNYADINQNNITPYHQVYDTTHGSNTLRALFRSLPFAYTWDDHDYAGNDSDTNRVGKNASRLSYYANVPHYPLALPKPGPIAQAFSVGRVRFILLDARSERNAPTTKIGTAQMAWLKQELLAAKDTHPAIGLGLGVPWISTSSGDRWGETAADRAEISNFIKDNNITGIFGMHGDAHMLAYDDGSNNNYANGGGPNFPTFNAAAMDRSGSTKGGPYSGGTIAAGGQYGLMAVTDNGGDQITLRFSGLRHGEGELMTHTFTVPAPAFVPRATAWRSARFGTSEPTGNAADDADPDGDGLPNLVEYALGLNPLATSTDGRPTVSVTMIEGEPRLTFTHRRRTDDPQLIYRLEGSTDLVTWTPLLFPPHGEPVAAGAEAEAVTLADPDPHGANDYRFLRLSVGY